MPADSDCGDAGLVLAGNEEPAVPPPPGPSPRRFRRCLRSFFTHLFSNVGLFTLVGGYVLLGALLFEALEGEWELKQRGSIKNHRDDCLKELWSLTERLNVLYERNWTQLAHEQLRRFETRVVEATKEEGYDGKDLLDSDRQWSFSGALLYSVTVITTIGYGNLAPKTPEGKVMTMLYALVGVPLMLLCLSNLGSLLADTFQFAYSHACCKQCARDRHQRNQQKHQQHQKEPQCHHQQQPLLHQIPPQDVIAVPIRVGYCGMGDGTVSLGPSIECSATCGPKCMPTASFGYYSGMGTLPLPHKAPAGDWGSAYRDVCTLPRPPAAVPVPRPLMQHNTVVKTANNRGQVVTHLHTNHTLTPEVHRLLTECAEYQVSQEEPGAVEMLRELQMHPPCPAQHQEGLDALEEEPDDDDDEENDHNVDGSSTVHATPSRVPLICRSNSIVAEGCPISAPNPVKRAPPPPPRRYTQSASSSSSDSESTPRVPMYLVLLGLTAYICLGAAVFAAWEEWSLLDGAYFCFVTLSTIGFGDLVPGKSLKRAESQGGQLQVSACVVYLLLGLVLIATSFSLVQEQVLAWLSQVARSLGIMSKHQHHHRHRHHHHRHRSDDT